MTTTTNTISKTEATNSKFQLGRLLFASFISLAVLFISLSGETTNVFEAVISTVVYFFAVAKIMKNKIYIWDFAFYVLMVILGTIYGSYITSSFAGGLSFGVGFVGGICAFIWFMAGNLFKETFDEIAKEAREDKQNNTL